MGTFAPAVDYIVSKKLRSPLMPGSDPYPNWDVVNSFPAAFGYTQAQFDAAPLINVTPSATSVDRRAPAQNVTTESSANVTLLCPEFRVAGAALQLPVHAVPRQISIVDLHGATVRELQIEQRSSHFAAARWDGRNFAGMLVSQGTYGIVVAGTGFRVSDELSVCVK
jgi:hypothetical protein